MRSRSALARSARTLAVVLATLAIACTASAQSAPHSAAVRPPGILPTPPSIRPHPNASSTPQVATPVLSLAQGTYSGTQTLTITDSTAGATIYYTTNGTAPIINGHFNIGVQQYSNSISISTSEIVVAVALETGYPASDTAIGRYFIGSSKSSFIYTVAGTGIFAYEGDGGPAVFAQLNFPQGVALDATGNIYLADTGNNVIRKIDSKSGTISTIAGTGIGGSAGDGGPATSAQLSSPYAIAIDKSGNIFTMALQGDSIRRIDAASGTISTIKPSSNSAGSLIGVALACDPSGNLYMSDGGNAVWTINQATGAATVMAGNAGNSGYSGDGGPAINALLNGPSGLAFDSVGNLYIADTDNEAIRKINTAAVISTVAGGPNNQGGGDGGPAIQAGLAFPASVTVDSAGNLYIADTNHAAIRVVNTAGFINTIAGPETVNGVSPCGGGGFGGDGDPATSVCLFEPSSIVSDPSGNIYLADPGYMRVRKITVPVAPPTTQAQPPVFSLGAGTYATPQTLTISDPTQGAAIHVNLSSTTATGQTEGYHGPIDLAGTITVSAIATAPGLLASSPVTATFTITQPPMSVITTIAGNGNIGSSGNGGPATSAELSSNTYGVAVDGSGNVYIADSGNNSIRMVSAATGNITIVAGTGQSGFSGDNGPATSASLSDPEAVTVDSAGNLYIADTRNYRVRMVAAKTGVITTIAGNGSSAYYQNWGDGGPATNATVVPQALAVDNKGSLFIGGYLHVSQVNLATGIITTVAGSLNFGALGDGGPAVDAFLDGGGVAVDSAGNLYIADDFNGRVRKVTATTGIITTIAGNGDFGMNAPGVLATNAEINLACVAVDSAGNVYFCSSPLVQTIEAATGILSTVAGNSYFSFNGDGIQATMAGLENAFGIAFDASGNLYIAGFDSGRIRKVVLTAPAPAPTFDPPAGSYTGPQSVVISDTAPNATFYYATDGSTPTAKSTQYNGAINVTGSETINAIAVAAGYAQSSVGSAAYAIQIMPTIALASSTNPSVIAQSVTFTATLSSLAGTPTGSVAFYDGTTPLGSGTLASGVATFTTTTLAAGAHSITAQYSGDANFASVTSTALTQTVNTFSIGPVSGAPTTASGTPGSIATYVLSVTPPASNAVTLSITGLPVGFNSSFSPNSVAAGAGVTNVELTINIPSQVASAAVPAKPGSASRLPLAFGLVLLPLLGLRKRFRGSRFLLLAVMTISGIVLSAGLSGCSHNFNSNNTGNPPQPGTYTLTVTATAGTQTQTATLTLIVL